MVDAYIPRSNEEVHAQLAEALTTMRTLLAERENWLRIAASVDDLKADHRKIAAAAVEALDVRDAALKELATQRAEHVRAVMLHAIDVHEARRRGQDEAVEAAVATWLAVDNDAALRKRVAFSGPRVEMLRRLGRDGGVVQDREEPRSDRPDRIAALEAELAERVTLEDVERVASDVDDETCLDSGPPIGLIVERLRELLTERRMAGGERA